MRSIITAEPKLTVPKVNQENEKDFAKIYEESDEECVVFI